MRIHSSDPLPPRPLTGKDKGVAKMNWNSTTLRTDFQQGGLTFPFWQGDLLIGTGRHIGLCTLWTPRSKYSAQLDRVAVIGNLYSRFGIGILIRNVLAVPEIACVVVTGVDSPEVRQRQADALLHGDFEPQELFLEAEHVSEFYRRTTLVDARYLSVRQQAELGSLLDSIPAHTGDPLEPLLVPLPEVHCEAYPTARSGHLIRAQTIEEAHWRLLYEIRTFGELTPPDSEGHRRQELWQLTVCLSGPLDPAAVPFYTAEEILRYGEALWNGDEPEDVTYRYGHTLRYRYGDQVRAIIEAFQRKPETFRTVLSLWEPLASLERDDEPCLILIHPRIRNGILDMYAYIRTNEMFRGWPQNAAGLRYWQGRLARELDVAVGDLTLTSGSAHLYDHSWSQVDAYLQQHKVRPGRRDPKGDWRLACREGQYVAEHYQDGRLLQMITAPSARALRQKLAPFVSEVSHALYLGRELARLEESHPLASKR